MNYNLHSIHYKYKEELEENQERMITYLGHKFGFSKEDMEELFDIAEKEISRFFNIDKALKKNKEKDKVAINSLVCIFLSGFFFSAYLSNDKYFCWPPMKE